MKHKPDCQLFLIVILSLCLVSCKPSKGYYGLKLNCGSKGIEFISKNEFIEYGNLGYDFHSYWNYGIYQIENGKIKVEFKSIPEKKKYKSRNSYSVTRKETRKDSVEIEIRALRYDSTRIDYFQVILLNKNTGKLDAGSISDGGPVKITIGKESLPCRLTSGILGGNEIEVTLKETEDYIIDLYFDDVPIPTYDKKLGTNGVLSWGKDSIGRYIEFEELNGEKLLKEKNRYYKTK